MRLTAGQSSLSVLHYKCAISVLVSVQRPKCQHFSYRYLFTNLSNILETKEVRLIGLKSLTDNSSQFSCAWHMC